MVYSPSPSILKDATLSSQYCETVYEGPGVHVEGCILLHTQNQILPSIWTLEPLVLMGILNLNILQFQYHIAVAERGIQLLNPHREALFSPLLSAVNCWETKKKVLLSFMVFVIKNYTIKILLI